MPLPLLIPVIMGIGGAIGAVKSINAAVNNSDAKDINSKAKSIANNALIELEKSKENVKNSLESYGEKKIAAINIHLRTFVDTFGQIKNVEFASGENIDDLSRVAITEGELKDITDTVSIVGDTLSGGLAGLGGGALAAFGAYNGTMLLASAGTGTAISTLSGAAATNATLAWLGGGTLASGGLGVAGGTMILGVMAAGPALLIFGSILGATAKKNLNDAMSNLEKAKKIEAEFSIIIEKLRQMFDSVNLCYSILDKFSGKMRRANKGLINLIEESGSDYNKYNEDEKKMVFVSVKLAQVLKMIIDLPLLNEEGELIKESIEKICNVNL